MILIPRNQSATNVSINISEEKSIFTHHTQIYTENGIKLSGGEKKRKEQRANKKERFWQMSKTIHQVEGIFYDNQIKQ